MYLGAGLVATILEPEWRTPTKALQALFLAFITGYYTFPIFACFLGMNEQLSAALSALISIFARHLLLGILEAARRFATNPFSVVDWCLRAWRRQP